MAEEGQISSAVVQPSSTDMTKDRDYCTRRYSELKLDYTDWEGHYRELSEFFEPRRGRFDPLERNRGKNRTYKNIINSKGSEALRRSTAGMFAGVMSPSRPWFTFTMMDRDILMRRDVQIWLEELRRLVFLIFNAGNLYNMAPTMLKEIILFGTGCMTHVDDFDDVARFYTHTVGSYFIGQNDKLVVDTLVRRWRMTTNQMIKKYGEENVSTSVRTSYNNGNYNNRHTVYQLIEPNPFRDRLLSSVSSEFLAYRALTWEPGNQDKAKFLERKGFRGFPGYCPRWELTGEDLYGNNCPAMIALGDTKQLQNQELEKSKAIAKQVTPPTQGPPSFRNKPIRNLPGGFNVNNSLNQKIESIYNVRTDINALVADIDATERRIDKAFYMDLFLAITDIQGIQPKNELQLTQVNEERLLMIGPVLEQIHGEWLSRMVARTVMQVMDARLMPPAPSVLEGKELDIEFISALANAQRTIAVGGIERTMAFAGVLIQGGWDVSDKVDADFALEEYSSVVGAPAKLLLPKEQTEQLRRQKEAQVSAAQALEAGQQAASIAKTAADAKLDDDNVLTASQDRVANAS